MKLVNLSINKLKDNEGLSFYSEGFCKNMFYTRKKNFSNNKGWFD